LPALRPTEALAQQQQQTPTAITPVQSTCEVANNASFLHQPGDPLLVSACTAPDIAFVRVNVHLVLDKVGGQNYQRTEDGAVGIDENGYRWAQQLIWAANDGPDGWGNNPPMGLPLGNATPNPAKRIRLVLEKVYFDEVPSLFDSERMYSDGDGNRPPSNVNSTYLFDTFGKDKSQVINIFVMNRAPNTPRIRNDDFSGGVAFGAPGNEWIKLVSPWTSRVNNPNNMQIGPWQFAGILAHEIGHVFGLPHAWSGDNCTDTPDNPNCWGDSPPCSNNVMDNGKSQCSLTPCQLDIVHSALAGAHANLVADCSQCPPVRATFGLEAGHQAVTGDYTVSTRAPLILNGSASVHEDWYTLEIYETSGLYCRDNLSAPLYNQTTFGSIDSHIGTTGYNGDIVLSSLVAFQPNHTYLIRLTVASDCNSATQEQDISTYESGLTPECPGGNSSRAYVPGTTAGADLVAYPNPAGATFTVLYQQPKEGGATITLRNALGRVVRTITDNQPHAKGARRVEIPTADLPLGTYSVEVTTAAGKRTTTVAIQH
jgi:hypothetical protein